LRGCRRIGEYWRFVEQLPVNKTRGLRLMRAQCWLVQGSITPQEANALGEQLINHGDSGRDGSYMSQSLPGMA
jgi:hypothetical protein